MLPVIKRIEPEDIPGERRSLMREVASLVAMGMPIDESYELVGIEPREGEHWPMNTFYLPTPAMVAEAMCAIRDAWLESERRRRIADEAFGQWAAPVVRVRAVVA